MQAAGEAPLTWGGRGNLESASEMREEYLASLREADGGDYGRLITFAIS
jgi:hypothetical protein